MKKLAILLALLIIPCTAFGLEMMSDNAMDDVTGQSGVTIGLDDIQLFLNIDKLAWVDCDGFTTFDSYGSCTGLPGAVGIGNFQLDVININGITSASAGPSGSNSIDLWSLSCGDIPLFYDYGTSSGGGCHLYSATMSTQNKGLNNYSTLNSLQATGFEPRALTIDATAELPALTEGIQWKYGTLPTATFSVGGVLIGIPTVEIYLNELSMTPIFDDDVNGLVTTAINDDDLGVLPAANFGTIVMQGVTFTTLSGWLEIAPH